MRTKFSALLIAAAFIPSISQALEFPLPRDKSDECQVIRDQIDALPKQGGVVTLPAKTYNCKWPVIIARDNVTLQGTKETRKEKAARLKTGNKNSPPETTLRLADWVHEPLLVIGHPHTIEKDGALKTPWRVKNVKVLNMNFDGNLDHHYSKYECGENICDGNVKSIRNNAITIRGASYVHLKNVTAHDSISGGLVTEKFCDNLKIEDFESHRNYFDGFAGYETTNSVFKDIYLHNNRGAGISIDIQFNNNKFIGGLLQRNNDVGIFARDLEGNEFIGMKVINSGSFGAFFASSIADNAHYCASNNTFKGVQFIGSGKAAIRINDGCKGNVIRETTMKGNLGCLSDSGQSAQTGNHCED